MEIRCPKCGLWQDDGAPECAHMRGRQGGLFTLAKRGRDGMAEAGRLGAAGRGASTRDMRALGSLGGVATRRRYGYTHLAEIGRRGGAAAARAAEGRAVRAALGLPEEEGT